MNPTTRQHHRGFVLIGMFFAATAAIIIAAFLMISGSGFGASSATMLRVCLGAALLISLAGFIALILWWRRQPLLYRRLCELERAYHKLNMRYETVFQNTNDMIIIADKNMKIVAANERALTTYGYTRDEMLGMSVALLRPSATRSNIESEFAVAKAQQEGFRFETETLGMKKDGTVFPIQSSLQAITLDGETFYISIEQDITEKQGAVQALEDLRREQEEIFQAIHNPAFILDPDHGIVSANRAMQQALGMTEEQLKGKKCYEVLHRSDHAPTQCPFIRTIASKQTESSEIEVGTLGGTYLVSCTPIFDASGKLTKVIHIAADITQLKKALMEAEESRQRFMALATFAHEAIVVTDAEGTIVFWNPAAEQMFGFSADEAIGQSYEICLPEDVRQQNRESRDIVLATGRMRFAGKHYKSKACRRDGTVFPVEVSTSMWQEKGKIFFASFVHDITEREQKIKIESQLAELRQWQKLTVGREERIIELKNEVNELLKKLGLPPRYSTQVDNARHENDAGA